MHLPIPHYIDNVPWFLNIQNKHFLSFKLCKLYKLYIPLCAAMKKLTPLTKQTFNIFEHSYMFRPCMVIIRLILEQIRYKLDSARNEIPFLLVQIVQWSSSQLEDALIKLRVNSLPYTATWVLSPPEYHRTTTEPTGCPADYADILLSLVFMF